MRRVLILVLLALALPAGYWAWAEFIKDPSEAIIAELRTVARLAEFDSSTEGYRHTANIARLAQYFSSDVEVKINDAIEDVGEIHGRDELELKLRATPKLGNGLKVEFMDIVPKVGAGNRMALVNLTLRARFLDDSDQIAEELQMTMRKSGGNWMITRVETVHTLKP
jgi:hypothetical protein